jgi:colicin import membrane protein
MVSIEELLRDAHAREEQERRETLARAREAEQRRADELRRAQEAEEVRLRAEDAARRQRVFDDAKKQAELRALHEGTIARARAEAEARARLAEMSARQEHERALHALRHDEQKKRLTRLACALAALAVAGAIGAGVTIKRSHDAVTAADERLRSVREERDRLEKEQLRLKRLIGDATDPAEVADLQRKLAEAQERLRSFAATPGPPGRNLPAHAPPAQTVPPVKPGRTPPAEGCPKGDPLCATIP